ncbi:thioredoxin [Rhodobacterales bacterium HKCCE4037]|nr:thioredoxin [Rhodobacterales bacterium HKCCE4037]
MRLTCPNCGARYEVDESMIPAGGRDVQCSNCSTTWFQPGPRVPAPEPPAPEPTPTPTPEPEVERHLEEIAVDGPTGAPGQETRAGAQPRPARRQVDAGVADILREEAEREARLRRGGSTPDPVETQSEMPLESDEDRARARRLAELDAAEDAFDTEAGAATVTATGSRSELLPDIEEINSTLRATGDRSGSEADATDIDTIVESARRRGAVRRGFFLVLLLAAIGAGIYAYAGQIATSVPQAAPYLDRYVETVNSARFWLDDMARSLAGGAIGSGE